MIRITMGCLISLMLLSACQESGKKAKIDSGRIEFKIAYETDSAHEKLTDLLPRRMKMIFNKDTAVNIMEGFMGMYKLNSMTCFRTRKSSTLLKVPKYSFLYEGKKGEPMCCFNDMDNMLIKHTGEVKEILGFTCQKAEISFTDSDETFSVYYTHDIDIRNPNCTNPYRKIDGVLMEFELSMFFIKMRFTADKFVPVSGKDIVFNVPRNSQSLSRDQMCKILGRYLE